MTNLAEDPEAAEGPEEAIKRGRMGADSLRDGARAHGAVAQQIGDLELGGDVNGLRPPMTCDQVQEVDGWRGLGGLHETKTPPGRSGPCTGVALHPRPRGATTETAFETFLKAWALPRTDVNAQALDHLFRRSDVAKSCAAAARLRASLVDLVYLAGLLPSCEKG